GIGRAERGDLGGTMWLQILRGKADDRRDGRATGDEALPERGNTHTERRDNSAAGDDRATRAAPRHGASGLSHARPRAATRLRSRRGADPRSAAYRRSAPGGPASRGAPTGPSPRSYP